MCLSFLSVPLTACALKLAFSLVCVLRARVGNGAGQRKAGITSLLMSSMCSSLQLGCMPGGTAQV